MAEEEVQVQEVVEEVEEATEAAAFTQEEVKGTEIKVFGKWSTDVEVQDMSLSVRSSSSWTLVVHRLVHLRRLVAGLHRSL